jgi:hypothetical protein
MADVSAETVLDAAVVSALELSFLLHAVSANTAMANVAMLDFDPFINIVPLPLPIWDQEKTAPMIDAVFRFVSESGKNRTHRSFFDGAFACHQHEEKCPVEHISARGSKS